MSEDVIITNRINQITNKKDSYKTYIIIFMVFNIFIFISLFFNVVKCKYENITLLEISYIDYFKLIFNSFKNIELNTKVKLFVFTYSFCLIFTFCSSLNVILFNFGGIAWKKQSLKTYKKRPYEKFAIPIILAILTILCIISHFMVFDYISNDSTIGLGFWFFNIGSISSISLSILNTKLINIELELDKYAEIKKDSNNMIK